MATQAERDDERFGSDVPVQPRSGLSTCLMGCLVVLVIMLIVGVAGGVWLWYNWRGLAATAVSEGIKQSVAATELPAEEKQQINEQVDRVAESFRSGQLTTEGLVEITQNLVASPAMTAIFASAIDAKYVARSGLSDEEKAQARQTLRRFLRGITDQKISQNEVDAAMAHVAERQPDGNWKLRDQLTDDQLREFLDVAKASADKAGIPDEAEDFDPSDEIKRIVDEALAK